MPSKPRPKTFVAAVPFSCAGERFAAGDEVPASVALESARRHGDRFVTTDRTPVPPPAATDTPDPAGDGDTNKES